MVCFTCYGLMSCKPAVIICHTHHISVTTARDASNWLFVLQRHAASSIVGYRPPYAVQLPSSWQRHRVAMTYRCNVLLFSFWVFFALSAPAAISNSNAPLIKNSCLDGDNSDRGASCLTLRHRILPYTVGFSIFSSDFDFRQDNATLCTIFRGTRRNCGLCTILLHFVCDNNARPLRYIYVYFMEILWGNKWLV